MVLRPARTGKNPPDKVRYCHWMKQLQADSSAREQRGWGWFKWKRTKKIEDPGRPSVWVQMKSWSSPENILSDTIFSSQKSYIYILQGFIQVLSYIYYKHKKTQMWGEDNSLFRDMGSWGMTQWWILWVSFLPHISHTQS